MAYGDFKGLTASDKVLRDKTFNINKNPKYDGYQKSIASMVYKYFDRKTSGVNNEVKQNLSVGWRIAQANYQKTLKKKSLLFI